MFKVIVGRITFCDISEPIRFRDLQDTTFMPVQKFLTNARRYRLTDIEYSFSVMEVDEILIERDQAMSCQLGHYPEETGPLQIFGVPVNFFSHHDSLDIELYCEPIYSPARYLYATFASKTTTE